jgi:hypothetical protein
MKSVNLPKTELEAMVYYYRLTAVQIAARLGISEKTVRRYMKAFAIDGRLWWKYQQIVCPECGDVIDPNCELDETTRKKMLRDNSLCEFCKKEKSREQNRIYQQRYRDRHRKNLVTNDG